MTTEAFNKADRMERVAQLYSCCGSVKWSEYVADGVPFSSMTALIKYAEDTWYNECGEAEWLEAFDQHPRIGDKKILEQKFAGNEQAGIKQADEKTIEELASLNAKYEKQNGFIFIVCATGKQGHEMLAQLNFRLKNDRDTELSIAMGEQHKISIIRLHSLFAGDLPATPISQLTTHVLDTMEGKPGSGMNIFLMKDRRTIACGITDADGRVADLLPPYRQLEAGNCTLVFQTGEYYKSKQVQTFYPVCEINFTISGDSHYHVPLLISPFGYSTYRGS